MYVYRGFQNATQINLCRFITIHKIQSNPVKKPLSQFRHNLYNNALFI